MIKIFKIILFIILLVLLALTAFVFTFDANNYKTEIIEQVEQQTGRDFDIAGDISLSVFPWIGLKVENVSLGNAKGFSAAPMLSMSQLDVKVMVLPLLKKEIEVDKVRLHGLSVSLETDAQGVTNWSDLASPAEKPVVTDDQSPPAEAATPAEPSKAAPALAGLAVNGIELIDARIRWLDASTKMEAIVTELSLETGAIGFDKPVDVEFNAHVVNNQPEVDARIALNVQLSFNEALNRFSANQLALKVDTMMQALSKEIITLEINADAVVDLQQQNAKLRNAKISALGATINAELDVSQLDTTPAISGTISSNSINAKLLAASLQIELPPMANADSLTHVSLASRLNATPSSVALEDFKLELDQSAITGWLRVPDMAQPKVRYQLSLNKIRLDDYMPPVADKPVPEAAAVTNEKMVIATGADRIPEDIEIALPVDLLRKLDLDGRFEIQQLEMMDIAMSDLVIKTQASQGVVKIDPVSMKLLDGEFSAKLRLDVNQLPDYQITARATDLHAGPVVNPILKGLMTGEDITLQGAAQFSADIKTRGSSVNTLKQAATGQINFDMNQTALGGVDIEYFARKLVMDYLDQKKLDVPSEWRGEYRPGEKTAFDKIHASAALKNGVVSNNDFIMDSKHIDVTGKGVVNIMNNTMDYNTLIDLTLNRNKTFAEQVLDEPIGVHIHGPFEQLAIEPDKKRIADAVKNLLTAKAKAEAEQKLEEQKARLKEKADAEKAAAREKLEQEKEDAKNKMEDKLKSKFKGLF